MKATFHALKARLQELRYAFLVLPLVVTAGLGLLALVALWIDSLGGSHGVRLGLSPDPGTARAILDAIVASVAAVAAITFSIAIVALQLVSQQFSPRALRGFLGDRISQLIAGTFTGTIAYCLVALRAVDAGGGGREPFVPSFTVTVATLLALASFVVLLVFVSHISQRVQVSRIAGDIAEGALETLDEVYPEPFGHPDPAASPDGLVEQWRGGAEPLRVYPERPGYVQSAAIDDLPQLIGRTGMRMHVCAAPGDFVALDDALAEVWGSDSAADEVERQLRRAIAVKHERDVAQDYLYAVRQLADIAIKAISPAINDPTTAWTCIAYVGVLVERLVRRGVPARVLRYPNDIVVVVRRHTLRDYLQVGFVQVGRYASRDARVAGKLVEELGRIARAATDPDDLQAIDETARGIAEPAIEEAETDVDRAELERALEETRRAARGRPSGATA